MTSVPVTEKCLDVVFLLPALLVTVSLLMAACGGRAATGDSSGKGSGDSIEAYAPASTAGETIAVASKTEAEPSPPTRELGCILPQARAGRRCARSVDERRAIHG